MSRWKTNFDNQHVNELIQRDIATLEGKTIEGMSAPELIEYSRLLKVLKILGVRFSKIDPELYGLNTWANFTTWLNNANNQINTFFQNRNVGHLQNANTEIDNILNIVRPLDIGPTVEEFKSIAEANAIYQQKIVDELERVKAKGAEIKGQLDALSNAIVASKTRLDENNQTIQQQKGRLDQSIAEYQKQFAEAQEKRSIAYIEVTKTNTEKFNTQSKQFDAQFTEASSLRKDQYDKFVGESRVQSNRHLEFLNKREEEVNKIFGIIGTTAFAGNFKTTADKDAKAANLWRWIALGLMCSMIVVGIIAFYYSLVHPIDWETFAFRLGTVLVLAIPAIYAANESSKHRESERMNRKIHLELASIDAYLVLLPEAQRNTIKATLADKFFGVPEIKSKGDEVSQKDLFGVLTTVVSNLTKGK